MTKLKIHTSNTFYTLVKICRLSTLCLRHNPECIYAQPGGDVLHSRQESTTRSPQYLSEGDNWNCFLGPI